MAVAEVCRNVTCVGAEPVGLTDCLNFGSPERPEIMRQFARAIDGMAAACEALKVPIVSGNVSLYNETDGRAVLPTPTVAVVGLVRDEGDVVRSTFPAPGLRVLLLGAARGGPLGGSEYVARRTGDVKGPVPSVDLDLEARLQALVLDLCRARPRLIESAHDVAEGGLALAVAEACVAGDDDRAMIGAEINLAEAESAAAALFGEAPSRIVISTAPEAAAEIERLAAVRGVESVLLGTTGGDRLRIARGGAALVDLDLGSLREARERALDSIVGSGA
jgi:phosphoribosylformylglycinamidine synthase